MRDDSVIQYWVYLGSINTLAASLDYLLPWNYLFSYLVPLSEWLIATIELVHDSGTNTSTSFDLSD